MPIYEYQVSKGSAGCEYCAEGFEILQKLSDPLLEQCPKCGKPVTKQISAPSLGASKSGFDDRAKSAGFHKLEKRDKGTYEKKY